MYNLLRLFCFVLNNTLKLSYLFNLSLCINDDQTCIKALSHTNGNRFKHKMDTDLIGFSDVNQHRFKLSRIVSNL